MVKKQKRAKTTLKQITSVLSKSALVARRARRLATDFGG